MPADDPVRLDDSRFVAVVEAQPLHPPDRLGHVGEQSGVELGVDDGAVGVLGTTVDRRGDGLDAGAQSRRKHLIEFGERAPARLFDPGDARRRAQSDRDGDRLVVVEHEWRQVGAHAEPVETRRPALGVDRVAERAQPVDVVADRAPRDAEAIGEFAAGPFRAGLQKPEQREESGRSVGHAKRISAYRK